MNLKKAPFELEVKKNMSPNMYLYYIFILGLLLTLNRFRGYVIRFFQAPSLWFTLLWFTFTYICLDLESLSVKIKVLLGTLSGVLYGIIIDQNVL